MSISGRPARECECAISPTVMAGRSYTGHSLALDSVVIENNIARSGGGVCFAIQYPGQVLNITNSLFLDNTARDAGELRRTRATRRAVASPFRTDARAQPIRRGSADHYSGYCHHRQQRVPRQRCAAEQCEPDDARWSRWSDPVVFPRGHHDYRHDHRRQSRSRPPIRQPPGETYHGGGIRRERPSRCGSSGPRSRRMLPLT